MNEYSQVRRISYGEQGATFIPVCKTCGRFVKADETMRFTVTPRAWVEDIDPVEPNATCKKCGRVGMIFDGFY